MTRTAIKTVHSAADASTTQNSDTLEMRHYVDVVIHGVTASTDAADGTLVLQGSLDNTNWDDLGTPVTFAAGAQSEIITYNDPLPNYIRISWSEGSNTAGTITTYIQFIDNK